MRRFAVVADTHFYAEGRGCDGVWWNRTLSSRSLEIGRCLVETLTAFAPDFVIHCGDLPGSCDLRDWEAGMAIMDQLGCPSYGAIGNHETWNPGVRAAFAGHAHIHDFHAEDGIGFCLTGSLREYPSEFRMVEIASGVAGPVLRATTQGLRDGGYAAESYVAEWGNRWVAGAERDRHFVIQLGTRE